MSVPNARRTAKANRAATYSTLRAYAFAPGGRRRRWLAITQPCTHGSRHAHYLRELADIGGVRRGGCGCQYLLDIRRVYRRLDAAAVAA